MKRFLAFATLVVAATPLAALAFHVSREVALPGTEGWDYLAVDRAGHTLFVSHGSHVEIVDADRLVAVGAIADTPGVHGIALAEDLGKGFISAGAANEVVVFDLKTHARTGSVKTSGANPDAILYVPETHEVLTFNGRGRNVTAIDARTLAVRATLDLKAKPEFAVTDGAGHVYVNLEDVHSLARIDARALELQQTWRLEGCEEPSGLALDVAHDRLFSVCANKVMVVTDARTGRQVAKLPIGEGVDGVAFDPTRQEAYASAGDGTLTVVKEQTPDRFVVAENAKSHAGARTIVLDETHHRLFLSAGEQRNRFRVIEMSP